LNLAVFGVAALAVVVVIGEVEGFEESESEVAGGRGRCFATRSGFDCGRDWNSLK
jgi:hypothetical protein